MCNRSFVPNPGELLRHLPPRTPHGRALSQCDPVNTSGLSATRALRCCTPVLIGVFVAIAAPLQAEESDANINATVARIDEQIIDGWRTSDITPADECSDAVFVRRLYLDLVGRVPTVNESQTYLVEERSDKRAKLVELLLESEDHVQHFADTFDTLLMGRCESDDYDDRKQYQWRAWLERVFRQNRPWNKVVAEILLARPESDSDQGVVWFLYERRNDHQEITVAIDRGSHSSDRFWVRWWRSSWGSLTVPCRSSCCWIPVQRAMSLKDSKLVTGPVGWGPSMVRCVLAASMQSPICCDRRRFPKLTIPTAKHYESF
ncbi:MAG TPA: DUF1549 domain-containing protein [Planctomycetes bacterium]|nr:DUF1549 domain-containing protein [Fuerstiella sp.]HIK95225.1 DUF1549 domain-containing protein [Planctomycetota bacterium]